MASPAPAPNASPIIFYGPASIGLRVAGLFPGRDVVAFDDDWAAIDEARRAARELGLAERVHIHHAAAAPRGLSAPCCVPTHCAA